MAAGERPSQLMVRRVPVRRVLDLPGRSRHPILKVILALTLVILLPVTAVVLLVVLIVDLLLLPFRLIGRAMRRGPR